MQTRFHKGKDIKFRFTSHRPSNFCVYLCQVRPVFPILFFLHKPLVWYTSCCWYRRKKRPSIELWGISHNIDKTSRLGMFEPTDSQTDFHSVLFCFTWTTRVTLQNKTKLGSSPQTNWICVLFKRRDEQITQRKECSMLRTSPDKTGS